MANIKKNATQAGKYIVIPRSQQTYEEKFAVANNKKIPFETPVVLTDNDVKALERQKEPLKRDSHATVYEIMDKYRVDQKKAAKILQAQQSSGEMGTRIAWSKKYILQAV
jgi:hypothetical protein